jgi:hypothetical protein
MSAAPNDVLGTGLVPVGIINGTCLYSNGVSVFINDGNILFGMLEVDLRIGEINICVNYRPECRITFNKDLTNRATVECARRNVLNCTCNVKSVDSCAIAECAVCNCNNTGVCLYNISLKTDGIYLDKVSVYNKKILT